ncbi:hypothetical protein [Streptomyces sp. URMC 123]|uniref:hypothetical protein n=1 Tax=Streptomyces sp. URMC 123 TaxID=3423403 RepID=UPI003F19D848
MSGTNTPAAPGATTAPVTAPMTPSPAGHRPGAASELRLNGTIETPAFLGERGASIFACLHRPAGEPSGLVVICSSIGAEWKYNYRREVLLARLAAERGLAAVRFHYLGVGHSDDGEEGFDRMVADARLAERWALDASGARDSVFFGTKFGALVAAAAGRPGARPLAVWGAPRSGADYFRTLLRVGQAGRLAAGITGSDDPRSALESGAPADIVGYTVHPALYASALELSFDGELGAEPRKLRLVEIAAGERARRALERRGEELRGRGFAVSTACLEEDGSWWLHNPRWEPEEGRPSVRSLVEETVTWLESAAGRAR